MRYENAGGEWFVRMKMIYLEKARTIMFRKPPEGGSCSSTMCSTKPRYDRDILYIGKNIVMFTLKKPPQCWWLLFHNLYSRTLGDFDVLIVYKPPEGGSGGSTICAAESHASRGRSEHAAREVNLGPSLMQAHCSSCYNISEK